MHTYCMLETVCSPTNKCIVYIYTWPASTGNQFYDDRKEFLALRILLHYSRLEEIQMPLAASLDILSQKQAFIRYTYYVASFCNIV